MFCPNTNFLDIDVPSPPRNSNYSIESYGIANYSVRIQWEAPTELGGVEISSYVVNIMPPGMKTKVFNTTERSVTSSFLYNYEYEVNITAENCNGSSKVTSTTIIRGEAEIGTCNKYFITFNCIYIAVSCDRPSPPANGAIEPYSSIQEGAEVQYHCDEGHTSREWRTSQCQENGTWAPDPALLNCTFGKF